MTDTAVKTPIFDLVASALDAMRRGGAMRVMDIPDDSSYSSHTFSGEVSQEISRRADLAAAPAQVRIKPLVWKEVYDQIPNHAYAANTGFGRWVIVVVYTSMNTVVYRLHGVDYPTIEAAQAAAQAGYESRILAAIEPQPDPRDEQRRALERVIRNQRTQIKRLAATAEAHWRFVNRVREERMADPRDEVIALAITACRVIDDAALEGYDNAGELLMHLLSALEPARAALAAAKAVMK